MKRKIMWMRFLLIGVISFLITNCKSEIDYRVDANWIYINETNHSITYAPENTWNDFNVGPKDTTIFIQHGDGPKDISVESYVPIINALTVMIDGTKCNTELAVKLHDISSYEAKKIDDRTYEFTFRYTEENTSDAVNCN
jgi:hypothetical protein